MEIIKANESHVIGFLNFMTVMQHEFETFNKFTYDKDYLKQEFNWMVNNEDYLVAFIMDGTTPAGLFIGNIYSNWYSPDKVAVEQTCYLLPQYRKGTLGIKLYKLFERWAEEKGADHIVVGNSTKYNQESFVNLFQRLGYSPSSISFMKEV